MASAPDTRALSDDNTDDLFLNYYAILNVPYNASPDAIEDAFLRLVDDSDTFQKRKRMVFVPLLPQLLLLLLLHHTTPAPDRANLQICDAFMCLASSDDRAAYDAFFVHMPCGSSKRHWLAYRDQQRRLTWDDTERTNIARLQELQQLLREALVQITKETGIDPFPDCHRSVYIITDGARANGSAGKPSKRARRRHRAAGQHGREGRREREERAQPTQATGDPGGISESGQNDNTLLEVGGQASLAESTACVVTAGHVDNEAVHDGIAESGAKPGATPGATPEAAVFEEALPVPGRKAPSPPVAAAKKPLPQTLPRKPVPKETNQKLTGTGTGTGAGPGREATRQPTMSAATPLRNARNTNTAVRNSPAPAPAPALPGRPNTTTSMKATSRTTPQAAKPRTSTATDMTAAAISRARPPHRPAGTVPVDKTPASKKTPGMPAAAATQPASSRVRNQKTVNGAAVTPLPRERASNPARRSSTTLHNTAAAVAPSQKKHQEAAVGLGLAGGTSAASVDTVDEAGAASATQPDKQPGHASPKRRYLAHSRWANPMTCANGRSEHPRVPDNWPSLSRPGKCAACGRAAASRPSLSSLSYFYWCRTCDTALCSTCYVDKIVRGQ